MLFSGGKDSCVMLHLARKAFFPARPPFPLLHVSAPAKGRRKAASYCVPGTTVKAQSRSGETNRGGREGRPCRLQLDPVGNHHDTVVGLGLTPVSLIATASARLPANAVVTKNR